jgi:DNA replication protein DnaC
MPGWKGSRFERWLTGMACTAIASDSAFSEWARTFTDPRLCAAIVDRLTFDASIVETGTESFRLRTTKRRRNTRRAS